MTYFCTLVFMLLVFWRPQEWLVPWMYGWPLLDVVVGIALGFLVVEVNEGRTRIPKHSPQIYLLLGLWLSAPISHIPHTYFAGMLASIMPVFKICFFTFLLFVVVDGPLRLRVIVAIFVLMACIMSFHCMLQVKRGYGFAYRGPYLIPSTDTEPEDVRTLFFGIFGDPNDLAQFLAASLPLCFSLTRRHLGGFLVGCAMAAYILPALLSTGSRGGIVGLSAVVATRIILFFPERWFPYLLGMAMLGALALCPFSGAVLDESAHERVVFWGFANYAFKQQPLFGLGYDMFWQVVPKSLAAHNAFVACYTELGIFGYWFWFGLIQLGIIGAWRTRTALKGNDHPDAVWLRDFAGNCMCAMVGFCGSAYFLSRTFIYPFFFLMAMLGVTPLVARPFLPADCPPVFNLKKDVYRMVTLGTIGSIFYIYISIRLLNKAWD